MARRRKTPTKARKRRKKSNIELELSQSASHEIGAIVYGTLAILSILSIQGSAGILGETFRDYMELAFGRGIWFFPIALITMAVSLFFSRKINIHSTKLIGIGFAFCAILGLMHTQTPFLEQTENLEAFGGYTGFASAFLLRFLFEDVAARIILVGFLLVGVIIVFELSISDLFRLANPKNLVNLNITKDQKVTKKQPKIIKPGEKLESPPAQSEKVTAKLVGTATKPKKSKGLVIKPPAQVETGAEIKVTQKDYPDWEFPELKLLEDASSEMKIDEKLLLKNAKTIKEKFQQFGIFVEMYDVNVGPTVTQYTLQPHEGVKLNKITALKDDLALALAAKAVRIEAPISGKSLVGIEIPNENRMVVHLREILESKEFKSIDSELRLTFGRDVSGKPIVFDLAKMPHMLIAGRTGSGKSVGMNAFLVSLLYQNSPRDLRFIMVDPKRVELMPYNGIPHLLTNVIVDVDKAIAALRWAVAEMNRRLTELSHGHYRNIAEYNEHEKEKMSKIVIVIDELADLMMRNNKKEVETLICRIAQMARAVGMHLIIATQRPSVDVITGVIKANIPTRVAFAVASGVDSRTILDSIGAEDLMGLGDMLVLNNGSSTLIRVQGILVSRKEIEKVTNKIKSNADTEFTEEIELGKKKSGIPSQAYSGGISDFDLEDMGDEKVPEAIEVIKKTGKASATLLQRYLSVGYARAAKILDIMEEKGMIGPSRGSKPREIFFLEENTEEASQATPENTQTDIVPESMHS